MRSSGTWGENPGGGGSCLLGSRARSWGGVIPSSSDTDGEIAATGFSTLCVCSSVLLGVGGLGDAATMASFITPAQITSSMLGQLLSATTRAMHQWSSWTALQNVSGGTPALTVYHWSMMVSMMVSSFHTSQYSWVSQGSLGPKYSFLLSSVKLGEVSHVLCTAFWVAGRWKATACWWARYLAWASLQCSSAKLGRGQNSSHNSGSQLSFFR